MKDLNKFEEFETELNKYLKKNKLIGLMIHYNLRHISFMLNVLHTITDKQFKYILKLYDKYEVTFSYRRRGLEFKYK